VVKRIKGSSPGPIMIQQVGYGTREALRRERMDLNQASPSYPATARQSSQPGSRSTFSALVTPTAPLPSPTSPAREWVP